MYYADGGEEIIHANRYVIELCGCSSYEELLEFTGGSFRGFANSELWQKGLKRQIRRSFSETQVAACCRGSITPSLRRLTMFC